MNRKYIMYNRDFERVCVVGSRIREYTEYPRDPFAHSNIYRICRTIFQPPLHVTVLEFLRFVNFKASLPRGSNVLRARSQ